MVPTSPKGLAALVLVCIFGLPSLCAGNQQGHFGEDNVEWPSVISATEGSPWPLPQQMQTGSDVYTLSENVFRYVYLSK